MITELLDRVKDQNLDIVSPYIYQGHHVPRVTSILSDMLHEEYLMDWANNVGLYQHKKHDYYRDRAASIGTYAHKGIEICIKNNISDIKFLNLSDMNIPNDIKWSVRNAIESFLLWWNTLNENHDVEVLMQETILLCQYYGGTVDLVISVDGIIYIVDFKTSNHPSYKYHLQIAAYKMIIENV